MDNVARPIGLERWWRLNSNGGCACAVAGGGGGGGLSEERRVSKRGRESANYCE